MRKLSFIVHNHQPVGNFENVFEDAFKKAYWPFISVASKYDYFKFGVHYSGPLLRWLKKNKPSFIGLIKDLLLKGRVEILSGSFSESILPIWDFDTSKKQVERMSELVFDIFGVESKGMWLAERAWEPNLPDIIEPLEYVVVDDIHLKRCGLYENDLVSSVFVADNNTHKVKLIASNEVLRYTIPFKEPIETLNYLNNFDDNCFLVFADDGEKFGTWPGTFNWVYKERWLERFLESLAGNIEMVLPKDLKNYPIKHANPPAGSYTELGEWALPYNAQKDYNDYTEHLKSFNMYESKKHLIQGGTWRNFLGKYDEANNMHKRVLFAKQFVNFDNKSSVEYFLDAQCNDAYWHGIFGGLYMPHLRDAVYQNIIKVTKLSKSLIKEDLDNDFQDEFILSNEAFDVFIKPNYSGSIFEIDCKKANFNILNTVKRHKEFYHTKLNEYKQVNGVESIHSKIIAKEKGLNNFLFYDKNNRYSFVDHFVKNELNPLEVYQSSFEQLNDIIQYQASYRDYSVFLENKTFHIKKAYTIEQNSLKVDIYNNFSDGLLYEELNFTFLSAWDDKKIIINNKSYKMDEFLEQETDNVLLIDNYRRLFINLSFTPTKVINVPVYTVSLSESGAEKLYQQTCFFIKCDKPLFTFAFSCGET